MTQLFDCRIYERWAVSLRTRRYICRDERYSYCSQHFRYPFSLTIYTSDLCTPSDHVFGIYTQRQEIYQHGLYSSVLVVLKPCSMTSNKIHKCHAEIECDLPYDAFHLLTIFHHVIDCCHHFVNASENCHF